MAQKFVHHKNDADNKMQSYLQEVYHPIMKRQSSDEKRRAIREARKARRNAPPSDDDEGEEEAQQAMEVPSDSEDWSVPEPKIDTVSEGHGYSSDEEKEDSKVRFWFGSR